MGKFCSLLLLLLLFDGSGMGMESKQMLSGGSSHKLWFVNGL
jgi:hypothetical protein